MWPEVIGDLPLRSLYTINIKQVSNGYLAGFKQSPRDGFTGTEWNDRTVLRRNDGCFLGE